MLVPRQQNLAAPGADACNVLADWALRFAAAQALAARTRRSDAPLLAGLLLLACLLALWHWRPLQGKISGDSPNIWQNWKMSPVRNNRPESSRSGVGRVRRASTGVASEKVSASSRTLERSAKGCEQAVNETSGTLGFLTQRARNSLRSFPKVLELAEDSPAKSCRPADLARGAWGTSCSQHPVWNSFPTCPNFRDFLWNQPCRGAPTSPCLPTLGAPLPDGICPRACYGVGRALMLTPSPALRPTEHRPAAASQQR